MVLVMHSNQLWSVSRKPMVILLINHPKNEWMEESHYNSLSEMTLHTEKFLCLNSVHLCEAHHCFGGLIVLFIYRIAFVTFTFKTIKKLIPVNEFIVLFLNIYHMIQFSEIHELEPPLILIPLSEGSRPKSCSVLEHSCTLDSNKRCSNPQLQYSRCPV